jgi:hypothetical protein
LPVGLLAVPALVAGARSVARINHGEMHAGFRGFMAREVPKLRERPRAMPRPLRLADLRPLTDGLEVFDGETPIRARRRLYQGLADTVVCVAHKALFPTGDALELSARRSRPFALEPLTELCVVSPCLVHDLPGHNVAVGSRGDVAYPEINTEVVGSGLRVVKVLIDDDVNVERVPRSHEVSRSRHLPRREEFPLVVAHDGRRLDPAVYTCGEVATFAVYETEGPSVQTNALSLEAMSPRLVPPVRFGNLVPSCVGELSRESISLPHRVVDVVMQRDLTELPSLVRHARDVLARFAVARERVANSFEGGARNVQLALDRKFDPHKVNLSCRKEERGFLRRLKTTVSAPHFSMTVL